MKKKKSAGKKKNGATCKVEDVSHIEKGVAARYGYLFPLWKEVPKSKAYSTVEVYNQMLHNKTKSRPSLFMREGSLPITTTTNENATLCRRVSLIKHIGTTREIPHDVFLVGNDGGLVDEETRWGIKFVLEHIEGSLYAGDSSLAFSGQSEQWDGLDVLIDQQNFIDLCGKPLQKDNIENAISMIVDSQGCPTDLFMSMAAKKNIVSDYRRDFVSFMRNCTEADKKIFARSLDGSIGIPVTDIHTQTGKIKLTGDHFIKEGECPPVIANTKAPQSPKLKSVRAERVLSGDFGKEARSGTDGYAWVVTACNRFGESAPSNFMRRPAVMTQKNKKEGAHFALVVENSNESDSPAPEYFRIYRSKVLESGGKVPTELSEYSLIQQIRVSSRLPKETTTIIDKNDKLPFTSTAYIGELEKGVITFRELTPMLRMHLSPMGPAYSFMVFKYGSLIMFAPKKFVQLKNIGTDPGVVAEVKKNERPDHKKTR